jgi:hypothetical protein
MHLEGFELRRRLRPLARDRLLRCMLRCRGRLLLRRKLLGQRAHGSLEPADRRAVLLRSRARLALQLLGLGARPLQLGDPAVPVRQRGAELLLRKLRPRHLRLELRLVRCKRLGELLLLGEQPTLLRHLRLCRADCRKRPPPLLFRIRSRSARIRVCTRERRLHRPQLLLFGG